eukprot:4276638-Pyramimonas_sp.AAC.1
MLGLFLVFLPRSACRGTCPTYQKTPFTAGSRCVDAAATPPRAFKVKRRQWPRIGQYVTIWRSRSHRSFKAERSTRCQKPALESSRH